MALLTYADRVAETTTTTGTGTIQLGGAVDGKFRTFVAGAGSGNTVPYVMVHRTANEWEVGYGVVTSGSPDTLTRAGVYSSSNGGSAVTFSAGTKDVFLGLPAGKTVTFDDTTGAVTLSSLTVSGNLAVDTNTFYVDAANNRVGVGTASPGAPLDSVSDSSAIGLKVRGRSSDNFGLIQFTANNGTTDYAYLGTPTANTLAFYTNGFTERMRLDASGNLGLGTATPSTYASGFLTLSKTTASGDTAFTIRNAASPVGGGVQGTILNFINDSGSTSALAYIQSRSNDGGSNGETSLRFGTYNGSALAERARITAGGFFKASNDGTYADATASYHEMRNTSSGDPITDFRHAHASNPYGPRIVFSAGAPDNNTNYFLSCNDTVTTRLLIYSDGDVANHDGVYGTISDAKLKQDITDANSQWDDLKAIRFRKYRFTSDVEQKGEDAPYLLGVVAQELRETSPGLVEAHPDTEQVEVEVEVEKSRPVLDEDGQPVLGEDGEPLTEAYTETETRTETRPTGTETLSVKQSILLMKAAVALQEAMARIETLEARLAALEAK